MEGSNCIVLNHVNQQFGKKHVLKDINLAIPYGCIYGLLGPSGCGKSTAVKIMAGINVAKSGEVYVLEEKMPKLKVMEKIGYMAQADSLYATLTAKENLHFFGSLYGMGKKAIDCRINEVMKMVNLTDYINTPVQAYSGGMKRRLSLALAILHQPPLLILDEPTVGIDPLLRKNIWRELNEMVAKGVSIVITTHVMDEVSRCHHVAMMREGKIIAKGTPQELQDNIGVSNIEEAFIYYGGGHSEG